MKYEVCRPDLNLTAQMFMVTTSVIKNEPVSEKTNNLGSYQVQHKPGCTVTEDGKRLEILDLESQGIVLSV